VVLRVARESAARSRLEKGPSGPYQGGRLRAEPKTIPFERGAYLIENERGTGARD
jgi:hypothetical protein